MNVVNEQKQNLLHQSVLKDNIHLLDFFHRHSNINLNLIDAVRYLTSSLLIFLSSLQSFLIQ